MGLVGRIREQSVLTQSLQSRKPEFLVVYGRRRVGKTFLIKEYFRDRFAFYATGENEQKTRYQLSVFQDSLLRYGSEERTAPRNWLEAFSRLRTLLMRDDIQRDPLSGKKVVFLDEMPWMDTPRSDFRAGLDYFWNSWGSSQRDLLLIVCGSATSWIIDHILDDYGGFYNRATRTIHLQPLTLRECGELFAAEGIPMSRRQMIESYMVFGGIPYYLNCMDRRLSLAQNIDELCFRQGGQLYYEYERLFQSLFRNPEKHMSVIRELVARESGLTRAELANVPDIGDGEPLTKTLRELDQSGFIRRYTAYLKKQRGAFYQLIDPFTMFSVRYLRERTEKSWMSYLNSPGYYAWCGHAFETVCLNHLPQIRETLGIAGVESEAYAWKSSDMSPGTQIDLLIDRRDQVINLCEMKFSLEPYVIDAAYEKQLLHRLSCFREETGTKKTLHLTLIASEGLKQNAHSGIIQNLITGDDLFR